MPQLDPTSFISQLFWLVITFVALYTVLACWALPRIQGLLAQREMAVSSDLDTAQHLTKEAERARMAYEQSLNEARQRSQQLFTDAALAQKVSAENAGKAMDTKIAGMLENAEQKIQAKKRELLEALTPTSAELAGLIVEKLTNQAVGNDSVQSIVIEMRKARRG